MDDAPSHARAPRAHRAKSRAAIGEKNRTSDTPFSHWLFAHNKSASQWAEDHKDVDGDLRWSASAVRAWMQPAGASGARRIPEEAAELIEAETTEDGVSAVPATAASWPSGISRR